MTIGLIRPFRSKAMSAEDVSPPSRCRYEAEPQAEEPHVSEGDRLRAHFFASAAHL